METPRWVRVALSYWNDADTYIFQSWADALFGLVVLLVLPGISILNVLIQVLMFQPECGQAVTTMGWNDYIFPIISLCLAGLYDTSARYQKRGEPKNLKLGIRFVLDIIVMVLSGICSRYNNVIILLIPPGILFLVGGLIVTEAALLIEYSIKCSKWYVNLSD